MRIRKIALPGYLGLHLNEHAQAMLQKCNVLVAIPLDLSQAVSDQLCSMVAYNDLH